jgi:CDP-diacylglycerol--glycerol-3-phosphate 3-phosphatidyltransferase
MIDGRRGRKDTDADTYLDEELVGEVESGVAPDSCPPELAGATLESLAASEAAPKRQNAFVRFLKALGPWLVRRGVSADHVTLFGLLVSAATGVLIGTGEFWPAIFVLTFGGLMDTLDGAVAKAAGTSSKRGAFFDSVTDRIADMFVFGGLAWYFAAGPGHDPKMALLPLAILGVANTISYERAKAESLGYDAKGGIMERAERLITVGVALLWPTITVPVLGLLLALCLWTATQRFLKVWRQASAALPPVAAAAGDSLAQLAGAAGEPVMAGATGGRALRAQRPPKVESRWRAWREASGNQGTPRRRQRVPVASRSRSRRRAEPLTTRVRRAFTSEIVGGTKAGARSWSSPSGSAGGRSRRVPSERRQRGAAAAFRRRLGSSRQDG